MFSHQSDTLQGTRKKVQTMKHFISKNSHKNYGPILLRFTIVTECERLFSHLELCVSSDGLVCQAKFRVSGQNVVKRVETALLRQVKNGSAYNR